MPFDTDFVRSNHNGTNCIENFFFQNLNKNNQRCVHEESILDIARASGGLSVVVKSTTNFVEIFLHDTNVPSFTERLHPKNIKTNQFRSIFKNPQITMIFNHLLKPEYFDYYGRLCHRTQQRSSVNVKSIMQPACKQQNCECNDWMTQIQTYAIHY